VLLLCAPSYCAATGRRRAWPRGSTPPPATWAFRCIVRSCRMEAGCSPVDRRLGGGPCALLLEGCPCVRGDRPGRHRVKPRPLGLRPAEAIASRAFNAIRLKPYAAGCPMRWSFSWPPDMWARPHSPSKSEPDPVRGGAVIRTSSIVFPGPGGGNRAESGGWAETQTRPTPQPATIPSDRPS